MTTPRVRTDQPPEQAVMIPDRMVMIGPGWDAPGGYGMELYVDPDRGDGRLLAVNKGTAVAAIIADANGSFTAAWTGEVHQDWPWCNAQRTVAHHKYSEHLESMAQYRDYQDQQWIEQVRRIDQEPLP